MSGANETPASPVAETMTAEQLAALEQFNHESSGAGSGGGNSHVQPLPGLEFLGMGYDVFGLYASVESCKQPILDLSAEPEIDQQVIDASIPLEQVEHSFNQIPMEIKLIYRRPKKAIFLPRFEIRSEKEFETTLDEQITKWSNHSNVGGHYGLFSGEVDARFSSNMAKLATTKYFSLVSKSTYWQLSLDFSIGHPAPLRGEVQEDLDNTQVTPAEFFEKYGTHYLGAVAIGCRVTISCAIETSKVEQDFDFSSFLSATYGGGNAGVTVSNDSSYNDKVKKFRDHSRMSVTGVGISDGQLDHIKEGAEASVAVLKGGWHNPSLIDFPKNALKPIWEHCKTTERRQAMNAEFNKMASERNSILSGLALFTPIYLYRCNDGFACYRIYPGGTLGAGVPESGGVSWTIQNGGKPLFYILARQAEGTVPLYQYRWKSDNRLWRYATADWQTWIEEKNQTLDRHWQRVSATPIGYVLNPDMGKSYKGPAAASVCSVFSYYPHDASDKPRFYYSLDADDHTREPAEVWERFNLHIHDLPPGMTWGTPIAPDGKPINWSTVDTPEAKLWSWDERKLPGWYAWSQA